MLTYCRKVIDGIRQRFTRIQKRYQLLTPHHRELLNEMSYYRGSIATKFPADFSSDEIAIISSAKPYTMTSNERLVSLLRSIDYIDQNNIQGDIVECGVWRGGSMVAACTKLMKLGKTNRKIFLFDTFEGMPPPSNNDKQFDGLEAAQFLTINEQGQKIGAYWCIADLEDVQRNISGTGYPSENVVYIKGKVEDTLPDNRIGEIALLRLDTDWLESTYHELQCLYDQVVPGGIIIIDDYGHWQGAKKAVDTFLQERNIKSFLHRIDYSGRLLVKPQ